jgi:hypothetical protein
MLSVTNTVEVDIILSKYKRRLGDKRKSDEKTALTTMYYQGGIAKASVCSTALQPAGSNTMHYILRRVSAFMTAISVPIVWEDNIEMPSEPALDTAVHLNFGIRSDDSDSMNEAAQPGVGYKNEVHLWGTTTFVHIWLKLDLNDLGFKFNGSRWVLTAKMLRSNALDYGGDPQEAIAAVEQAILKACSTAPYVWKYYKIGMFDTETELELTPPKPCKGTKRKREDFPENE